MRYLFFDIEGSNNYNFVAKMCTFGYVLTDENFDLKTKIDVIMNPESCFDKHILEKKMNAYPLSKYTTCPPFPYFYKSIKKIIEYKDQIIVGWSIDNDVRFIHDACERYNLQQIKYAYVDLQIIYMHLFKLSSPPSLESACEECNIKPLIPHKSDDDAHLTMLLAKYLCEKLNLSLVNLAITYKESCCSYDEYSVHFLSKEEIEKKVLKKNLSDYINRSFIKKSLDNPHFKSNDIFCFVSSLLDEHPLEIKKVAKDIKKIGCKTTTNQLKATILIVEDTQGHKTRKNNNGKIIKLISYQDLINKLNESTHKKN